MFGAPFGPGDLWEVRRTARLHPKLPLGHDASDVAVSRSGARLGYLQGLTNVNIWRLDLLASPPKGQKLVASSREQEAPSISPDGSKVTFESNRTGSN